MHSGVASYEALRGACPLDFQLVIFKGALQVRIDSYINSCGFLYPVSSIQYYGRQLCSAA